MELRPLDLGGIFDRSATLYTRNFAPFFAVAMAAIFPVSVIAYFIMARAQPQLDAIVRALAQPDFNPHIPAVLGARDAIAMTAASALFGYLMLALAVTAVAAGVARLYRAEPVEFRACYEVALPRWASIVLLLALSLGILIASYVGAFAIAAIPVSITALIAPNKVLLIMPLVVTGILLVTSFVLTMLVVLSGCGFCGIAIEECSAAQSLRLAFQRICNRQEIARALICSTAASAIAVAATVFVDLFAFLGLERWPVAYVAVDAMVRALVLPFVAIVLTVYYFDLRIRHEGFDIEQASGALAVAGDTPGQSPYAPTKYLSGQERVLVASFLARRDGFTPARRRAIAGRLAGPVRERVPTELQRLDDESLLERL
jgi:hypothetical protein